MASSSPSSEAAAAGIAGPPGVGVVEYPASGATPEPSPARAPHRSLISQAIYDTFGQTGARLGGVWIGLLALISIFAPFLANSHPWLVRAKGGGLSSPLIGSLGPIDVCLLVFAIFGVVILRRRPAPGLAIGLLLWPLMVMSAALLARWYAWPLITLDVYRPAWAGPHRPPAQFVLGWTVAIVFHVIFLLVAAGAAWAGWRATVLLHRATREARAEATLAVVAAALMLAATAFVTEPKIANYEQYRQSERAGELSLVVRTLVPYSPNDRLRDQKDTALLAPDAAHWLGTTQFNEDLLSRMLHACRVALAIGVISTGIATLIGIAVGGVMGYYGGAVDLLGMRLLEIIEAIPTLILLLIVTVFFGRSLYLMMIVIGLVSWTSDARFIRAEFLKLRKLDFVQAAVAAGLTRASIIFKHMLPNGVAPVLVNASFGIAGAILLESTLSFLGLGLGPDDPSWGQLLNQARSGGRGFNWWIATFPGLAIFLTVFAYVLIGESLRDAIDPRLRKRD